ncbi:MAG: phosphoenolpyruvate kinase [Candidatus Marinimicrobia bacterium]|nr:phosphoenolpyruvate kinase [Candidatus Neomarinimicrobiota bacterium]
MQTTLSLDQLRPVTGNLTTANAAFNLLFPGDSGQRQAVHTVYGGAHIFKAGTADKMGAAALKHMDIYAPNFALFAQVLGLPGAEDLPTSASEIEALEMALQADSGDGPPAARHAHTLYKRVREKLATEPVEDFRIDFEDGYGNRPDAEEDGHAQNAAGEVVRGMEGGGLPPFIGIRIKPLTEELSARAIRTLDIFITALASGTGGQLPENFVVTLPKVTIPDQVTALVDLFELLEAGTGLAEGSLKLEIMIETPQSLLGNGGEFVLPQLAKAARGRCVAAHFGVYDYTASNNITAAHQSMDHPACDFARYMMQTAFAGTDIRLSDGATNIMPVPTHRATEDAALTPQQEQENRAAVHAAWRLGFDHINHSLRNGFYQGWDLHPAQLPVRYAALYNFFLSGWTDASQRLSSFIGKAAQASLSGNVFDDAATGQALLNYFLRGLSCGAITEGEIEAAGLSMDDIRTRSFKAIMDRRSR